MRHRTFGEPANEDSGLTATEKRTLSSARRTRSSGENGTARLPPSLTVAAGAAPSSLGWPEVVEPSGTPRARFKVKIKRPLYLARMVSAFEWAVENTVRPFNRRISVL